MVDAAVDPDSETGAAEDAGATKKRKLLSGKRLVIGGGALLVVIVGVYMSGMLDALTGGGEAAPGEEAAKAAAPVDAIYYDLPDMLVNLGSSTGRPSYLKLIVSLELENSSAIGSLEKLLPRIIDNFQVYLRELRAEDLTGSAGIYRLKEELLVRVNTAVYPIVVKDVLFKEMLVQ